MRERATLLYGESAEGRTELGTVDAFESVLAPLLENLAAGRSALGQAGLAGRTLMRWEAFVHHERAYRLVKQVVEQHGRTADRLDAVSMRQAAVSVVRDPVLWSGWGTQPEVLVHLKDRWLVLVALGEPLR